MRDDVEAMELVCIKMEYVDDFEGPALQPCCCCGFLVILCATRDLVRIFALLFNGLSDDGGPR